MGKCVRVHILNNPLQWALDRENTAPTSTLSEDTYYRLILEGRQLLVLPFDLCNNDDR